MYTPNAPTVTPVATTKYHNISIKEAFEKLIGNDKLAIKDYYVLLTKMDWAAEFRGDLSEDDEFIAYKLWDISEKSAIAKFMYNYVRDCMDRVVPYVPTLEEVRTQWELRVR